MAVNKKIRVVKNWIMNVRSCPYCHEKNGYYGCCKDSNTGWQWICQSCGKATPLIYKEVTNETLSTHR